MVLPTSLPPSCMGFFSLVPEGMVRSPNLITIVRFGLYYNINNYFELFFFWSKYIIMSSFVQSCPKSTFQILFYQFNFLLDNFVFK